jgi:uncharacterized protein with beta-barrel porin domain
VAEGPQRPGDARAVSITAEDGALIDAGLDFTVGQDMTLGVSYPGQLASDLTDNAVKGRFTCLF